MRTYYLLLGADVIQVISMLQFVLFIGFVNIICDVKIGGIHQTLLVIPMNMFTFMSSSIGIYLCGKVGYDAVFWITFLSFLVSLVVSKKYAIELDNSDQSEFSIGNDDLNNSDKDDALSKKEN